MPLPTFFASAERAGSKQLAAQQLALVQEKFISEVIDTFSGMMLVLNEHRQIIAANSTLLKTFNLNDQSLLTGLRPGEAVNCVHSSDAPGGCGTSENCSVCGAVLTIIASAESGKQVKGECRLTLTRDGGTSLDLEVQATPVKVADNTFTFLALKDIAPEKRRSILERTFFHDVLNTIGGIRGIADILADDSDLSAEEEAEYVDLIVDLSDNLTEEISQQRRLVSAEKGEYALSLEQVEINNVLEEVCKLYRNHIQAPDRILVLEKVPELFLTTDRALLRRVVGNMLLNAMEATPVGGTVRVSTILGDDEVEIQVINPGEIPKNTQLKMFKRSFSTKSLSDRGIGTYSMKLFGERYLGGNVGFRCSDGETMFFIKLPLATSSHRS